MTTIDVIKLLIRLGYSEHAEYLRRLRDELAAEREKRSRIEATTCDCEIADPRDDHPVSECQYHQELRERAEQAEAACADYRRLFGKISALPRDYTSPEVFDRAVSEIVADALSTDAGRAYAERMKRYTHMLEAIAQDLDSHHADPACDLAWFITRVGNHIGYRPAEKETDDDDA